MRENNAAIAMQLHVQLSRMPCCQAASMQPACQAGPSRQLEEPRAGLGKAFCLFIHLKMAEPDATVGVVAFPLCENPF